MKLRRTIRRLVSPASLPPAVASLPVLALAVLLTLAGCASSVESDPVAPEEWRGELEALGLEAEAGERPLATDPEMERLARRAAGVGSDLDQLRRLQSHLFDRAEFPFTYQERGTLSAREAFAARRGNCVSFTSLFIALARSLGIDVRAALVHRTEGEREGELVVVNNHMVAAYRHPAGVEYYDFAATRSRPLADLEVVSDRVVAAIHLNNRGAEELRAGRNERALAFFRAATGLAPDFAIPFGNLGVAARHAGEVGEALDAYARALELSPGNPNVLANLARLHLELGRPDAAREALRAAELRGATPQLLVARGDLELAQGELDAARKLYRRARRLAPKTPEPLVAIARLELERGEERAARDALYRALAFDPEHPEGRRLLVRIGPYYMAEDRR